MTSLGIGCLLVASCLSSTDAKPKAQYDALVKEYERDSDVWFKQRNAKAPGAKPAGEWPGYLYARRFLKLAEHHPDDPAAVDALLWVVDRAVNVGVSGREFAPQYKRALEQLVAGHHLDDRRLAQRCRMALTYPSRESEQFLRNVLARSRERDVQAQACVGLGRLLASRSELTRKPWYESKPRSEAVAEMIKNLEPDFLKYVRESDRKALEEEAAGLFERAIEEFGAVVYHEGTGKDDPSLTVSEVARSELYELRHLSVGSVAPEISGEDIDGRPLRLSDFRGKVVVLSFWASWCGPCMQLVPLERALVDRLQGKPFVLLGINGDIEHADALKAVKAERITWRSWWNGGPLGPITKQWNIRRWPTIYVLDEHGVIWDKNLYDDVGESVDRVMEERGKAKP